MKVEVTGDVALDDAQTEKLHAIGHLIEEALNLQIYKAYVNEDRIRTGKIHSVAFAVDRR